jgi:hypothetical protein
LWEFNTCVHEYNAMQAESTKESTVQAWRTANFTGAAFAGKLRKLSDYIKDTESKTAAPKTSKEGFEQKLAAAERRQKHGS